MLRDRSLGWFSHGPCSSMTNHYSKRVISIANGWFTRGYHPVHLHYIPIYIPIIPSFLWVKIPFLMVFTRGSAHFCQRRCRGAAALRRFTGSGQRRCDDPWGSAIARPWGFPIVGWFSWKIRLKNGGFGGLFKFIPWSGKPLIAMSLDFFTPLVSFFTS